MNTSLDCIPCILRHALNVARIVSMSPFVHEQVLRNALHWIGEIDWEDSPPVLARHIRRRLCAMTGIDDPYREAKQLQNQMVLRLLPELRSKIESASDPLFMAVRLAIAGNVIDLGVHAHVTEADVRQSIAHALAEPIMGDWKAFLEAVTSAKRILYLADNAGEIVFDRLLIEQLTPDRVTLAVRGTPVLNDATRSDACAAGLHEMVQVIDNGSDVAGTLLRECSPEFLKYFSEADLILAKGQGNFETLSEDSRPLFFLFKAKCSVVATHAGVPVGTHVLARSNASIQTQGDLG
jgi:uncharacterized protein with ATP-grasp and redox domains